MGVNVEGATKMVVSQATGPNNGRVTFRVARAHALTCCGLLYFGYSNDNKKQGPIHVFKLPFSCSQ